MTHRRAVRMRIKANRERRARSMSTEEYLAWRSQMFGRVQLLCSVCRQAIPDSVWFDLRISDAFVCADCVHDAAALEAVYGSACEAIPKGLTMSGEIHFRVTPLAYPDAIGDI